MKNSIFFQIDHVTEYHRSWNKINEKKFKSFSNKPKIYIAITPISICLVSFLYKFSFDFALTKLNPGCGHTGQQSKSSLMFD